MADMLSWPGLAASRARAASGLFLTLLALVAATTGVIAGTVGYTTAAATATARDSVAGSDESLRLRTRLAPDPAGQERSARDIIEETFSPAPVLVAAETADGSVTFVVTPDVRRLAPDDLRAYADGAERLRLELRGSDVAVSGITVEGDLARAASTAARNLMVSRALGAIPLSVLALVTVLAVVQVARLLGDSREAQLALLVARGASARQLLALGAAESIVAVSVGAALGTGAALGAMLLVPEGAPHWRTVLGAAASAYAATLAIVLGLLALQVRRVLVPGHAVDRSGRTARAVTGVGLAFVLLAAAVSLWQYLRSGSPLTIGEDGGYSVNLVAGAAPALLLAAAGVVALGLMGPLAALAAVAVRRGRSVAPFLTAMQVARRLGGFAVPVVLTVLATGAATVSAGYSGTSAQLRDDMTALADGAPLRATLTRLPPAPADRVAPPLEEQFGLAGDAVATPVWLVDSATIGDLEVPATAVVPGRFAAVADGPVAVPDAFTADEQGPASLVVPEGTSGLTLEFEGKVGYDRWGVAYLEALADEWRDRVTRDQPTLPAPDADREVEAFLAETAATLSAPVRLSATLSVRDLESGLVQQVGLGTVAADGPAIDWDHASQSGFRAEPARFSGAMEFGLDPGRRFAVTAVSLELESSDAFGHWPRTVELTASLRTSEGTDLFADATDDWASHEATTPDLAAAALAERDAATPQIRWSVLEISDNQELRQLEHNALSVRPRLDTSGPAWSVNATTVDEGFWGSSISPATEPAGPTNSDPAGRPVANSPIRVALTEAAADAAALAVGDDFRMQLMNRSVSARLVAITPAVPGDTRPVGALVDVTGVAATFAAAGDALRPPSELWVRAPGDPGEVARALAGSTGATVKVAGSSVASDPTSAARTIFWVASAGATLLAVTGIAAATRAMTTDRRAEIAVLRALGMAPADQARSRAAELAAVVVASVAFGLAAGWAVSLVVVPPLARATIAPGQVELPAALALHTTPWLALLVLGAAAVSVVLWWLRRRVAADALDTEYREEVR